ncbi:MAG: diguanylate cyclase [Pseudomonadota bacterium]
MQTQILVYLSPAITVIFTAVFLGLWWIDRSRLYVLCYASWFGSVALATALQAFLVTDFGPWQLLLLHSVLAAGAIIMLWGVARRNGTLFPIVGLVSIALVNAVICWFAGAYQNQTAYIVTQNLNAAMMFAFGAYGAWLAPRRAAADRLLVGAFAIAASYGMIRPPVLILMQSQMAAADYQASAMLTINMVINAIIALFLAMALIATIMTDTLRAENEAGMRDGLSGLPTRAAFEKTVRTLLTRAGSERITVSLIVCDIDHFKRVNDTHGHSAGDQVIASFGHLIASKIRPGDIAGRVGGEEFCILAWNCPEQGAAALAERLRSAFEKINHPALPKGERTTASFGVTEIVLSKGYAHAFECADAALYEAKRAGRNQVQTSGLVSENEQEAEAIETGAEIVDLAVRKARSGN